jgi:LemA protein
MMKKGCLVVLGAIVLIVVMLVIYGVKSYNGMVTLDEKVKAAWGQVENVYQRRFDLIPNLVATVQGYAAHEKETFQAVTEARAKVGGVFNISQEVLSNPEVFQKFQAAQSSLTGALQRLMAVSENYPELKANENFLNLQSQLEGTENRIAQERRHFNQVAQEYNTFIKRFPRVIIANLAGFREKAYFKAMEEAQTAPKVQF